MLDDKLAGVLDREQPLVGRDQLDQRLGEGGLARAGRAAHQDVLAGGNGGFEESRPVTAVALRNQLRIDLAETAGGRACASEQTGLRELIDRKIDARGLAHREGWRAGRRHRGYDDLAALPAWQNGRADRGLGVDVLPGEARGRDGQRRQPVAVEFGDAMPMPTAMILDADFAGLVDDKLRHLDRLQQRQDRCEIMA